MAVIIKGTDFLRFLDDALDKMRVNLWEYEEFHGEEHLADMRRMNPMDAFLYGVARGKVDMLEDLRLTMVDKLNEQRD